MAYLKDEFGVRYDFPESPTMLIVGRSLGVEVPIGPISPRGELRDELKELMADESKREEAQKKYRSVSRLHAIVNKHWSRWFMRDTNSSCGTFADGTLIGESEVELKEGSTYRLGNLNLTYHQDESENGGKK